MRRKRNVKLEFWVTPDEKAQIEQKMSELGTENLSAYLRKMAIDGRILKLDLPELRELLSLMRRYSGNLNQIAKRVNSTHRVYAADLDDIQTSQAKLWQSVHDLVLSLAKLKYSPPALYGVGGLLLYLVFFFEILNEISGLAVHYGTELAQRLRRNRPVMPYALERLRVYALIGKPVIRNILCLHQPAHRLKRKRHFITSAAIIWGLRKSIIVVIITMTEVIL